MQENKDFNPLTKYNKLKRFSGFVAGALRKEIDSQVLNTDCLHEDIYTISDMKEKLDSIANCATIVEIRKYHADESGDEESKIHNGNFCGINKVCPICADRQSKRRRALYSERIKRAVARYAVEPGSKEWNPVWPKQYTGVYLGTATIQGGDRLKERIDHLLESIKRMRKYGQKRKGVKDKGEFAKIECGISNGENKQGRDSNKWHSHLHFLIFTSSPLDMRVNENSQKVEITKLNGKKSTFLLSKFNQEWYKATEGQGISFDLRPIQYRKKVKGHECKDFAESVELQSVECFKYQTQLSEEKGINLLKPDKYLELLQKSGKRRLFNPFGHFRCDKRNIKRLMDKEEIIQQKMQYIDKLDSKTYEIYSSSWNNAGIYNEPLRQEKSVFKSSDEKNTHWVDIRKKIFLAQTAIYQGQYRKSRNVILNNRSNYNTESEIQESLDKLKECFQTMVSVLWSKYNDNEFIPEYLTAFDSGGVEAEKKKYLQKLVPF